MANQSGQSDKSERGFAAMDENKQREIAKKGGEAVSEDRQHMAEIGRKGGEASQGGGNSGGNERGGGGGQRGGTSEQHAEAGRQSHKNR
jgi:general stress protein YciG